DGTPTYHLASVVDDVDFEITHIVRGNDHRPNEALHRRLFEALGAKPPEFVHHGLILGEDGKKLAKRAEGATVASLRAAGIPAEAMHVDAPETLARFRELLAHNGDARELVRELKAVGGDLRSLRLALTGRDRGPELWAVIAALPADELLRRIDAAER